MRNRFSVALLGGLLLLAPVPASAQAVGTGERVAGGDLFFELVPTVTAASRYTQDVSQAPASISIISREEIHRMGYRTLAELLTSTRGIYASNDRNYTYLGLRGFARTGNYNTRLLVLVDGHRINEPVSDYVGIGHEFPLAIEDIERVEIIRGPGSALYGTNAVLGVVNVITRRPVGDGVVASVEGGSFGTWRGHAAWDGRVGAARVLVSGGHFVSAGETLFFPELAGSSPSAGLVEGADGERSSNMLAKVLVGQVQVEAGFGHRYKEIPTGAFETDLGAESFTTDRRLFTSARYEHVLPSLARVTLRAGFDDYRYEGTYIYEGEPFDDFQASTWGTLDGQYVHPWGRHRIVIGSEVRFLTRLAQGWEEPNTPEWTDTRTATVAAAFIQDEIQIGPAHLTVGLRHDYYSGAGSTVSPRGALVLHVARATTLKLLAGRAFRTPNGLERYYYTAQARDHVPALDPEYLTTLEAVLEQVIGKNARFTGSIYRLSFRDVVTLETDASDGELYYANRGAADGHGLELEVEGDVGRLDLRASYAYQRVTERDWAGDPPNAPRHLGRVGIALPLSDRRLTFGVETRAVSSRLGRDASQVPGYLLTSARVLLAPWRAPVEVTLSATNLFNQRVGDPGGEEHGQIAIPGEARSIRVGLRARF